MTERKIEVDMSSKAIDSRLRDVAQLRKLGLSIAKAKPIVRSESTVTPLANDLEYTRDLEFIRKRPGMYVGSTTTQGVLVVVFEAIDNAIDQFLAGQATQIAVSVSGNDVTVTDDGSGFPFDVSSGEPLAQTRQARLGPLKRSKFNLTFPIC